MWRLYSFKLSLSDQYAVSFAMQARDAEAAVALVPTYVKVPERVCALLLEHANGSDRGQGIESEET